MTQPLRILIVEDNELDALLLERILQKGGYELTSQIVETPESMREALLCHPSWDVITSDHSMPCFSAPEALAMAKELCPDVPFIIVSGEIDLNLAVSLMKGGAQDYIQKHEIIRIIPAIERELRESELKRDQKAMNNALIESEKRFREVLENSLDASYKRNVVTNNYEYLSPVFTYITGYSLDEMNQNSFDFVVSLIHPDDLPGIIDIKTKTNTLSRNKTFQMEYRIRHKNGHYIWLQDKFFVVRDQDGKPLAHIGSVSDINERKLIEEKTRRSERDFATLIENASDMIVRFDSNLRHIYCNPAVGKKLGKSIDNYLGKTPLETGGPVDQSEFVYRSLKTVMETDSELQVEQNILTPKGEKTFQTRIVPEHDQNGKIESLLAITRDIT